MYRCPKNLYKVKKCMDSGVDLDLKRIISLFLIMMMFFLSGCTGKNSPDNGYSTGNEETKQGGTLKMGCVPVDTLNPLITTHASVMDFLSLVYEGLFCANEDLTARPVLASGYVASDDNTVYTVKLKKDVHFHNGKMLDAQDVVATVNYITMYNGRYSGVAGSILLCQATDNRTVTFTLKESVSDFVNNLDFPILPAGLSGDAFAGVNQSFVPCGTGMYKYEGTTAYKNIHLVANENWHQEDKRPNIDKIDVEILSDEETIISAFDAGTVDILTTSWENRTDMNLSSTLYESFSVDTNKLTFIGINTASAAFDTLPEREVLEGYTDKVKLAQDIMLGSAEVAQSPVRENVYFNKKNEEKTTDDKNAKTLKVSSEDENGGRTEIFLLYNSDSKAKERLAMALKLQLSAAGYSVTLDGQAFPTYLERVLNCHYDIYIGEVSVDNSANLSFMFGEQRNGQNICCYTDPELAVLVSNVNRMTGKENKSVAWENFERYYSDKIFQIPLYFTKDYVFVNNRIKGKLSPDMSSYFNGFEDLYIDEQSKK